MQVGSAPHVTLQESGIDSKVSLKDCNPLWPKTLKELQTGFSRQHMLFRGPVAG